MKKPRVSILCSTYNHEKYIGQALDSFLMQKTNFDFEILIHDDASTDNTVNIINKYVNKHPNIIRTIFQKQNQFSKGTRGMMTKFLLPKAKGKYIALCNGDDFFTDINKLQIQSDFLDKYSDYSICFHPVRIFYESKEKKDSIWPTISDPTKFTTAELLKMNFIQTNSVMYRRVDYKNFPKSNLLPGDWFLHLYHSKYGKIGFIDRVMSGYRRHPGGIWWNSHKNFDELIKKNGFLHLAMYFELLKLFKDSLIYKKIINTNINAMFTRFINIDKVDKSKMVEKSIIMFPNNIPEFLTECVNNNNVNDQLMQNILLKEKKIQKLELTIKEKNKLIDEFNISIKKNNYKIVQMENDLNKIKKSKVFKIWQTYCKMRDDIIKKLYLKKKI